MSGHSLAVPWLGLCSSTAAGVGLIPGWGTKIPQAHGMWCSQKNQKLQWSITSLQSECPSLKKPTDNDCWREYGRKAPLCCWWECKSLQPPSRTACCCCAWPLSPVQLCATPWAVARQAPLSLAFSRHEHWSGLPCPPPEDFPDPGIKPGSLALLGFPHSSFGKESVCNAGEPGLIPGLGRSLGERIGYPLQYSWASFVAQMVNNLPAVQETPVWFLAWEDPLEKG